MVNSITSIDIMNKILDIISEEIPEIKTLKIINKNYKIYQDNKTVNKLPAFMVHQTESELNVESVGDSILRNEFNIVGLLLTETLNQSAEIIEYIKEILMNYKSFNPFNTKLQNGFLIIKNNEKYFININNQIKIFDEDNDNDNKNYFVKFIGFNFFLYIV